MKLRVLGCSGGIGLGLNTTSLLLDDSVLIDCGTGLGDLSLEEMSKLQHVFITHSHLDHIALLPMLLDTIYDHLVERPLTLHCKQETFDILAKHIFNWDVWPNFFELPNKETPVIVYESMQPGDCIEFQDKIIKMAEVNHVVPASAYIINNGQTSLAFSGDTFINDSLWEALNEEARVDAIIVECGFTNEDENIGRDAKHYYPNALAADLNKLKHRPKLYISHLQPGKEEETIQQLKSAIADFEVYQLSSGDIISL
ncbi:MAG: 3',5'-cyclic-nucleotide phosphodiesterase [Gammaproteobacteria bacterium]|nr:3',5'-cyclic-nucleotide phosphodiesterase [Gammaproteobacteria bacterium]